jgi:hypothetical protein
MKNNNAIAIRESELRLAIHQTVPAQNSKSPKKNRDFCVGAIPS